MTIKEGDFIKISYTGKLEDGKIFDTTIEEAAKVHNLYNSNRRYDGDVIIIGVNQIIAGLEEDIKLHDAGYEGTVSIPPKMGFGDHDPGLVKALPMKKFEQKPQVGMTVEINGQTGTVVKVLGRHTSVDFNIPMAGQTITYDYKIETTLEDLKDKAVGLSTLYTGVEMDIEIEGTVAKVNVPLELNYSQPWITSKAQMALDLLKYTDLTEVLYIETYKEDLLKKTADGMEEPEELNEDIAPEATESVAVEE
ncbi:MAG: peptidylprolyl isomerase [Methanosarcinales archaeon]|nr:peptidylprolyl isomerase [Methanosarcinales archaeon]